MQDIITDCEVLHLPIVDGALGAVIGGVPGGAVGVIVGFLDEAFLRAGFTSGPYLSSMFLGGAIFESLFSEKVFSYALGSGLGLAVSLGGASFAEEYLSSGFQNVLHIQGLQHLSGGQLPNALLLAIGSVALGVTESIAFDSTWVSRVLQSSIQAKIFFGIKNRLMGSGSLELSMMPSLGEGLCVMLLIFLNGEDLPQDAEVLALPRTPQELYQKMHFVMQDLIGEEVLGRIIARQSILLIALPILAFRFNQYTAQYIQGFKAPFNRLSHSPLPESFEKAYQVGLWGLVALLIISPTEAIVRSILTESHNRHLSEAMRDGLNHKVWQGEMPMALSSITPLVSSMHANVDFFLEGRGLLLDSLDTRSQGIQALLQLNRFHMLDFVVLLQMIVQFSEKISNFLADQQLNYHGALQETYADLSAWHSELTYKGKMLVLKGKGGVLEAENLRSVKKLQNLAKWQNLYAVLERNWQQMSQNVYLIVNPGAVVYKAISASHSPDGTLLKPPAMLHAADQLTKAYGWRMRSTAQLIRFERGYKDLKALIDYMNSVEAHEPLLHQVEYRAAPEVGIRLEDFEIFFPLTGRQILYVPSLNLPKGVYALAGETGSGKSTFLSKLKGFQWDKFASSGNIIFQYPLEQDLKMHYIPQEDYFPPKITLFKQITGYDYDSFDHEEIKSELLRLAEVLNLRTVIENDLLKEHMNWQKRLSGGQKKCIAILSALLAKPQILLMDEVLNGMDANMIMHVQALLKSYLPDTLMIVVDHEHHSHNKNRVYDAVLNLNDAILSLDGHQ